MKIRNSKKLHTLKEQYKDTILTANDMRQLHEDWMYEMAYIDKGDSGLPYRLWLDPQGEKRGNEHSGTPRVKIELEHGDFLPIDVSGEVPQLPVSLQRMGVKEPPRFDEVKKYLIAYHKIIIAHYFNQLTDKEVLNLMKTIKQAPAAVQALDAKFAPKQDAYIEYYWNTDEGLYQADVIDNGNVIETKYGLTYNDIMDEIRTLKLTLDIENVKAVKK